MNEQVQKVFDEWFYELGGFSYRSEKFLENVGRVDLREILK